LSRLLDRINRPDDVKKMNMKAEELKLSGSRFENTTGLDDTVNNHTMSAYDIAILSSLLIQYDFITKYSSLWQDTIRDGAFTLTNTNRLVRYYDGCNGLKTGSTDKAGYCVSVSAQRNNLKLICIIMGADSKEKRNEEARALLDYGFSSVSLYESPSVLLEKIPVLKSSRESIWIREEGFRYLCEKGSVKNIEKVYEIPNECIAPLEVGQIVGSVKYYLDGVYIGESKLFAEEEARALGFIEIFKLVLLSLY
jgi:D-alanyl-D-alanine carboxypeptidase (penicillin-binding protein 5/6)